VTENEIGDAVIAAAMKVHSAVGPGLLESAYEACLRHELEKRELRVQTQVLLPLNDDDPTLDARYRIDLLIEGRVVVELKVAVADTPCAALELSQTRRLQTRISIELPRVAHARRHHQNGQWSQKHRVLCVTSATSAVKILLAGNDR